MNIDGNQPIIIITGYVKPDNQKEFLLNGASEYLCKPYTKADLKIKFQAISTRARLIYQANHLNTKMDSLGCLFWLLEEAISHRDKKKTGCIMAMIKATLPYNLRSLHEPKPLNG